MTRHCDISGLPVDVRGSQNVGVIDGHALGFMDRGRVSVVQVRIGFRIEGDLRPPVQSNADAVRPQPLDDAQRTVFHSHRPIIP
ncbi:hypothetical protein D3C85_428770 [compost metagenome]